MANATCWICGTTGPVKPTRTVLPGVKKLVCAQGHGCNK